MDTSPAPLPSRPGLGRARVPSQGTVVPMPVRDERVCARPSCRTRATATLSFSYADRHVDLAPLREVPLPQTYDLCPTHAARTRPPHGWDLRDRRPEDERRPDRQPQVPADLGGDRTVAVLAAALRAVPGTVSEDARPVPTAEVPPASSDARMAAPQESRTPSRPEPRPEPRPVPAAARAGS